MTITANLKCTMMENTGDITRVRLSDPTRAFGDLWLQFPEHEAIDHFRVGATYTLTLYEVDAPKAPGDTASLA